MGLLGVLSEVILEWLNVSGSSSRIAAGAAVLLVGIRDLFMQPPSPEPALKGWRAGIVPMAFPVILTPALAILAISAGSERGAATAVGVIGAAILLVAVIVSRERSRNVLAHSHVRKRRSHLWHAVALERSNSHLTRMS